MPLLFGLDGTFVLRATPYLTAVHNWILLRTATIGRGNSAVALSLTLPGDALDLRRDRFFAPHDTTTPLPTSYPAPLPRFAHDMTPHATTAHLISQRNKTTTLAQRGVGEQPRCFLACVPRPLTPTWAQGGAHDRSNAT